MGSCQQSTNLEIAIVVLIINHEFEPLLNDIISHRTSLVQLVSFAAVFRDVTHAPSLAP